MPTAGVTLSAEKFIGERLTLAPLSFRPDISLYRPTPQSGLVGWLAAQGRADHPPYWAYAWAGGAALALYLAQCPESVAGKLVLDFGSGSGLVGIAAARAGALVTAFEPDPIGAMATRLNAVANRVALEVVEAPQQADIVLAGDVFYDAKVAAQTLPALQSLAAGGASVIIGDPFRRQLPHDKLQQIAEYQVPDMGSDALVRAGVFVLRP